MCELACQVLGHKHETGDEHENTAAQRRTHSQDMETHNVAAFIRNREVKVKFTLLVVGVHGRNLHFFIYRTIFVAVVHHASISEKISTPSTICRKAWIGKGT